MKLLAEIPFTVWKEIPRGLLVSDAEYERRHPDWSHPALPEHRCIAAVRTERCYLRGEARWPEGFGRCRTVALRGVEFCRRHVDRAPALQRATVAMQELVRREWARRQADESWLRGAEIVRRREAGETLVSIARDLDLSKQRVSQLELRWRGRARAVAS